MAQTSASANKSSLATSGTHLGGADKVNSVNFSTCLHRLARFASQNNQNRGNNHQQGRGQTGQSRDQDDGRKQVLSDPRFALLVCSLAELAAGISGDISVKDGNAVAQTWRAKVDLDKQFDNVADASELEEADEVFASVVGQAVPMLSSERSGALDSSERVEIADEAMSQLSQSQKSPFTSREASNMCWALAKLRMAPPCTVYPLGRVAESSDDRIPMRQFVSSNEMALDVLSSSLKVRMAMFEHARSRKSGDGTSGSWIPELSRLAGKIIDIIAVQIINDYYSRNAGSDVNGASRPAVGRKKKSAFNPQEMASILWAFAKSKRGDERLFDIVAKELLRQTKIELEMGGQGPKPQGASSFLHLCESVPL